MQVAQLPASQEKGGDIPIWRAVCRIVVPGRCSVVSVRPASSIVTWDATAVENGRDGLEHLLGRREPLDVDPVLERPRRPGASCSTTSMNGPGPQT